MGGDKESRKGEGKGDVGIKVMGKKLEKKMVMEI